MYRGEIIDRFLAVAGGRTRLTRLHTALVEGDAEGLRTELSRIAEASVSVFDLTSENSWHMFLLGLLFNVRGYVDPISNREYGLGRPDIRLEPDGTFADDSERPLVTIELKYMRGADEGDLKRLAQEALRQIDDRRYDAGALPERASSRVRWGIACCGKRVAVVAETVPWV